MPGYGLSLTVRVSCQINLISLFYFLAQLGKHIPFSPDGDILGFIVMFRIKSQLAFGKVPYVASGGIHLIVAAQKLLDGLYFCW